MAGAHGVGSGANAHLWADAIVELIDGAGEQVVWRPDFEPPRHTLALMRTLGVRVEVVPVSAVGTGAVTYCPHSSCGWSFVGSRTRADGYLIVHMRVMHAGVDPRAIQVSEREPLGHVAPVEPTPAAPGTSSASPSPQVGTGEAGSRSESTAPPTQRETKTVVARRKWTREEILDAIKAHAAANEGVPPKSMDWSRSTDDHPSFAKVGEIFGKWNTAIIEAGFEPHKPGRGEGRASGSTPTPKKPEHKPVEAPPVSRNGNGGLTFDSIFGDIDALKTEVDRLNDLSVNAALKRDALQQIIETVGQLQGAGI